MAIPLLELFGVVSKVIDRVVPDKAAADEAKLKLLEMQQAGGLAELQAGMSAITAEAGSADPWTSRARPTFMYVFYAVILALVLLAPFMGIFFPGQMTLFFTNVKAGFAAIPDPMWQVFIAGYLGYAGVRGIEKIKGVA